VIIINTQQDRQAPRRRGALAVEAAIVHPVIVLLLVGLVVGGLAVFRYQQVALLAREAARAVSVKGSEWAKETGNPSPTQQQILQQIVVPRSAGMDPQQLTLRVEWIDGATGKAVDWDNASKEPTSLTTGGETVTNRLRVTVTYQWYPDFFRLGPLNLTSVSEMPMAY
jgi:Flp pilus assembly protein TadG